MIGQGSPHRPPGYGTSLLGHLLRFLSWLVPIALCVVAGQVDGNEPLLRLRVEWGDAGPWQWEGHIWLNEGRLAELRGLSNQPDSIRSIFLEENTVQIRPSRPRDYDGVELLIADAPSTAVLNVALSRVGESDVARQVQIPLDALMSGELATRYSDSTLDEDGNRLRVSRAPGDILGVQLAKPSLVFAPGELLHFNLIAQRMGLPAETAVQMVVELRSARGTRVIRDENLLTDGAGNLFGFKPVELRLPDEEGVYEIALLISNQRSRRPLALRQLARRPILRRTIQLVVIAPLVPDDMRTESLDEREVTRIDPVNPRWWQFLTKRFNHFPVRGTDRPIENGRSRIWKHQGNSYVQLDPGGWHAFPLNVSEPGIPHILEVSYPANVPQTLGINVVEPDGRGLASTTGISSGLHIPRGLEHSASGTRRHRLLFWPRSENPHVLMTNHESNGAAAFGTIRVLALPTGLSRPDEPAEDDRRKLLAYMERPHFISNFSATETLDVTVGATVRDWQTFYDGGRRLVEFLRHAGYDSAIMGVYADGSTIYPSQHLKPTPKFDNGMFSASAQDPVPKDVLEMLFRLFDREGLTLVPSLQFTTPLPALEFQRRRGGPDAIGIELVDDTGKTWVEIHGTRDGLAPFYNPLDLRVQAAMGEVVKEIVDRYGHHASFGGIALDISPTGYAVLPGKFWGLDDRTVAQFEQDASQKLPVKGRAAHLKSSEETASQWLAWRAGRLASFYRDLHKIVDSPRRSAILYLVGTDLLNNRTIEESLSPSLPVKSDEALSLALLEFGIDVGAYRKQNNIVLAQPRQIDLSASINSSAVSFQLDDTSEADRYFSSRAVAASLLTHSPHKFRRDTLVGHPLANSRATNDVLDFYFTPTGVLNRQRYAHALATQDAQMVIEGGQVMSLSQNRAVREFVEVYRRLPSARFTTVIGDVSTQPTVIRKLSQEGRTCVYLVNDSPWPVSVELLVDVPANISIESLGTRAVPSLESRGDDTVWPVSLEPYGFVAAWLGATDANIRPINTSLPEGAKAKFQNRIDQLNARLRAIRQPRSLHQPSNPGFEIPPIDQSIPDWRNSQGPTRAIVQTGGGHKSSRSLHIKNPSEGDIHETFWLRSKPFTRPASGRLATLIMLRIDDSAQQPKLRLSLDDGGEYYRFARVGKGTKFPLNNEWGKYAFTVDDLPLNQLSDIRVGLDLTGPGSVWVDDVQTFDLSFTTSEQHELQKILGLASYHLRKGNISDCVRVLDGYWPRYLMQHVDLPVQFVPKVATRPSREEPLPQIKQNHTTGDDSSWFNRVKKMTPRWLKF